MLWSVAQGVRVTSCAACVYKLSLPNDKSCRNLRSASAHDHTRAHKTHTDHAAQARGGRVERCTHFDRSGFAVGDVIFLFSLSIGHAKHANVTRGVASAVPSPDSPSHQCDQMRETCPPDCIAIVHPNTEARAKFISRQTTCVCVCVCVCVRVRF